MPELIVTLRVPSVSSLHTLMFMALTCALNFPPKWCQFRLAALQRVSRLMRHLIPSNRVSYPLARTGNPAMSISTYSDEYQEQDFDGFVVFEVEKMSFKVHVSLLRLEAWSPADSAEPERYSPDEKVSPNPIVLLDTAENFRYFLWDLQAFPHELSRLEDGNSDIIKVLDPLLNITEMASKHRLAPLEARALRSLRHFVLSPYFLAASPAQHCRTLRAATCSTSPVAPALLRAVSRRLTHHILRRDFAVDPALASLVTHDPRLQSLRGAVSYRALIALEQRLPDRTALQPVFPRTAGIDVETRMCLLAAHASLLALRARVQAAPPPLPGSLGPSHTHAHAHHACERAWMEIWARAWALAAPTVSADVLGCLRAMTPHVKRMVAEAPCMAVECGLAALEALTALRDEIIDGLGTHFEYPCK
ncbi:hypothetical protein GGX14DRAFT_518901 [Mycena pura]|uniref:BTB domain-containing protein n=1 Tax=Mycena pura TaxID=153505 RepID=A0AAD6YHI8_9AGAR|nr:hypothetical protein GGX14DRAFT_518901 [Mycena pura]